jgi:hypothetical protein
MKIYCTKVQTTTAIDSSNASGPLLFYSPCRTARIPTHYVGLPVIGEYPSRSTVCIYRVANEVPGSSFRRE